MPDPVDAIKLRMEQLGLSQKDMNPFLGNKSKGSEVLNRKRPLTFSQITEFENLSNHKSIQG